jgi:P27 family predicted phage terminase small subunit
MKKQRVSEGGRVATPPKGLRPATRRWWRVLCREFDLEQHHLLLLEGCCRAWDRAEEARELLDREGVTFTDRFGQRRLTPAATVERDQRAAFARMLGQLGVDLEAGAPGRPAGR